MENMWRRLLVPTILIVTLLLVGSAHGEIHRAKTLPQRNNAKPSSSGAQRGAAEHQHVMAPEEIVGGEEEGGHFSAKQILQDEDFRPAEKGGHTRETWVYSLISAILVGLSGIVPLAVIPLDAGVSLKKGAGAARLKVLLSFAVGGLLGDVFLHLLPEAWKHVQSEGDAGHMKIGLWVLAGLLSFLIIEKTFPDREDEEDDEKEKEHVSEPLTNYTNASSTTTATQRHSQKLTTTKNGQNGTLHNGHKQNGQVHQNGNTVHGHNNGQKESEKEKPAPQRSLSQIKTSGWLNLMANVIDNFTHGLAVAGSYCAGTKSGLITTVIILLHEIPHEVGDFAILLRSGFDRWAAAKAQLITATGGILGAFTALLAESASSAGDTVAWILPFTSGGFIYIALVSVVPELLKETNPRESIKQIASLISGILAMAFVALYLDEHNIPSWDTSWII